MKTRKEFWMDVYQKLVDDKGARRAAQEADEATSELERRGMFDAGEPLVIEPAVRPHWHVKIRVQFDQPFELRPFLGVYFGKGGELHTAQLNDDGAKTHSAGSVDVGAIVFKPVKVGDVCELCIGTKPSKQSETGTHKVSAFVVAVG